jgi:hypothetical protein
MFGVRGTFVPNQHVVAIILSQHAGYSAYDPMCLCALLVRLKPSPLRLAHYIRYLILNFGNVSNLDFNMW